jgi:multidrug efflux pump
MTVSGGLVDMEGLKRSISVKGEYKDPSKIGDIVIRGQTGATVYLKDIAEVKDAYKEKESFARLEHNPVITLGIIKKSGENLIAASDKIVEITKRYETDIFPEGVKVTITGDQSEKTRTTLHDLINTIIIGFVLGYCYPDVFHGCYQCHFRGNVGSIVLCSGVYRFSGDWV